MRFNGNTSLIFYWRILHRLFLFITIASLFSCFLWRSSENRQLKTVVSLEHELDSLQQENKKRKRIN